MNYRQHVKIHRGCLSSVYACPWCDYAVKVERTKGTVGDASRAQAKVVQHMKDNCECYMKAVVANDRLAKGVLLHDW